MSICDQFRALQTVNPYTKRQIKLGGPTHRALVKECANTLRTADGSPFKAKPSLPIEVLCEKFRKSCVGDKAVNPVTGNIIKVGGAVYKTWIKKCDDKGDVCVQFLKDQTVNPATGRKIKIGGSVHKLLLEQCEEMRNEHKLIKKVLGTTAPVTKKIFEFWYLYTIPRLDGMFREIIKTKGVEKRIIIFGDVIQKALNKIAPSVKNIDEYSLVKLFLLLFIEKLEQDGHISATRLSITVDILDKVRKAF